jgi:hypothetical protein
MRFIFFTITMLFFAGLVPIIQASEVSSLEQVTIVPLQSTGVIQVTTSPSLLKVDYYKKENDVFIECFINGFTFNRDKAGSLHQEGEGHLRLYINNEHVETLYQPAFIIEGLQKGDYEIKIVIVKNDRTPYNMEETLNITID